MKNNLIKELLLFSFFEESLSTKLPNSLFLIIFIPLILIQIFPDLNFIENKCYLNLFNYFSLEIKISILKICNK